MRKWCPYPPYIIPHSLTLSTHMVMSEQRGSNVTGSIGVAVEQGVVGLSSVGVAHAS